MKRFTCVCSVAVALLSWAPTATAADPPEGWGAAMYAAAQRYWDTEPPCEVTISFVTQLPPEYSVDSGLFWPDTCHIEVKKEDIIDECDTTIHEYGHAIGLEHSTNKYSVMYPYTTRYNVPAICVRLLIRYRPSQSRIAWKRL